MNPVCWRVAPPRVEEYFERVLPLPAQHADAAIARLRRAMRGAVFSGGKRLRCQLVLEVATVASTHSATDFVPEEVLPAAAAIEMIHAYSLVHDDLPAMDDAQTRRGKPSCHVEYGEATAILVGDALLTLAFETLTHLPATQSTQALRATQILARASGEAGMVGGQMIDIAWSNAAERDGQLPAQINGEDLLVMHALKTGALIRAACEMGAVLGGGDSQTVSALTNYGANLGRAFQLKDDLLDVEGDPEKTGKAATDAANDKITAPAFFGIEPTRKLAQIAQSEALAALKLFGSEADTLRKLARFVLEREK